MRKIRARIIWKIKANFAQRHIDGDGLEPKNTFIYKYLLKIARFLLPYVV